MLCFLARVWTSKSLQNKSDAACKEFWRYFNDASSKCFVNLIIYSFNFPPDKQLSPSLVNFGCHTPCSTATTSLLFLTHRIHSALHLVVDCGTSHITSTSATHLLDASSLPRVGLLYTQYSKDCNPSQSCARACQSLTHRCVI